jgi:hypothetical protein
MTDDPVSSIKIQNMFYYSVVKLIIPPTEQEMMEYRTNYGTTDGKMDIGLLMCCPCRW